ncbi:PHB depolymerase family esterase [Kribbella yunnanensis]|uniref:PHB depolymerase family esterase n=1 Tax=Kribbella yunnanensis TaxID=190194 RepID=A0ABP4TGG8_9ACTN
MKRLLLSLTLAAATLTAPQATTAAAAATTACSLAPTGGTVTRSFFPASTRSYNLRVPAGLTGNAPLLLSLHGLGSVPFFQEQATGWSQTADAEKFIVAYPAGDPNWNLAVGSPDVRFLRDVVDRIAAESCVDRSRVYVEGGSLGSWMSQRAACDAAGTFAAAAGFMGGSPNTFGGCRPTRPIAVALFHGESDPLIPVAEGRRTRDEWVARNKCSPTPVIEPVTDGAAQTYRGCAAGVTVNWRSYQGLGHAYPTGTAGADFRERAWRFLSAHRLP